VSCLRGFWRIWTLCGGENFFTRHTENKTRNRGPYYHNDKHKTLFRILDYLRLLDYSEEPSRVATRSLYSLPPFEPTLPSNLFEPTLFTEYTTALRAGPILARTHDYYIPILIRHEYWRRSG
jgi:hypothetical protein